jgi:hypothetical protein
MPGAWNGIMDGKIYWHPIPEGSEETMTNQRSKSWTMILAGLAVLTLTAFSPAQTKTPAEKYAAVLGTWEAQAEGMPYTFVFEFTLEDGVLKGKYTGSSGSAKMENLTFENSTVKFTVTVSTMTLDYTAVIDGDNLSGQVSLEYGQADITGKKRKQ